MSLNVDALTIQAKAQKFVSWIGDYGLDYGIMLGGLDHEFNMFLIAHRTYITDYVTALDTPPDTFGIPGTTLAGLNDSGKVAVNFMNRLHNLISHIKAWDFQLKDLYDFALAWALVGFEDSPDKGGSIYWFMQANHYQTFNQNDNVTPQKFQDIVKRLFRVWSADLTTTTDPTAVADQGQSTIPADPSVFYTLDGIIDNLLRQRPLSNKDGYHFANKSYQALQIETYRISTFYYDYYIKGTSLISDMFTAVQTQVTSILTALHAPTPTSPNFDFHGAFMQYFRSAMVLVGMIFLKTNLIAIRKFRGAPLGKPWTGMVGEVLADSNHGPDTDFFNWQMQHGAIDFPNDPRDLRDYLNP